MEKKAMQINFPDGKFISLESGLPSRISPFRLSSRFQPELTV
jgi:hypothetical protein